MIADGEGDTQYAVTEMDDILRTSEMKKNNNTLIQFLMYARESQIKFDVYIGCLR